MMTIKLLKTSEADHRAGVREDTGEQLEDRQRRVAGNIHERDPRGLLFHDRGVIDRGTVLLKHDHHLICGE